MNIVLTETDEPSLRYVIGALLARSHSADVAIANIRLAHVDVSANEIENVRMRILVGRFEAAHTSDPVLAARMEGLAELIQAGVVQLRSAGMTSRVKRSSDSWQASRRIPGTENRQTRYLIPNLSWKRVISSRQIFGSPRIIRCLASRSIVSCPSGRLTTGWGQRKYILSNALINGSPAELIAFLVLLATKT